MELQNRRATPINGYEVLLNARKILGRILAFPIKNKAGAYEQSGLGNFLNSRKLLDVGRLAFGIRGKESDKLFERLPCLFPLLFLHLANSPPKQQVLTVRYLNGRIASESFPDRVEGVGKPLQTHEAHRERIAHLPDDRLGIDGGPKVRDEFSIHLGGLAVFPLRVERRRIDRQFVSGKVRFVRSLLRERTPRKDAKNDGDKGTHSEAMHQECAW